MDEQIESPAAAARYVTHLPDGTLDGCYLQAPAAEHADRMIVIDEAQAEGWVNYRANEARDGLEVLPLAVLESAVPHTVTRRQARQALLLAGLLDDVPAAIDAIPDLTARRMAQIEWEDSLEFVRTRPLVVQIAGALGLDEAELDQLFITAAAL